jgi:hypothetical protein
MPRPRTAARWLGCALAAACLLGARAGLAATLTAAPSSGVLLVGEPLDIDLTLELDPGEEASVFEGRFDLTGVGSAVQSLGPGDVLAGGPSWDSSFGGVLGGQLLLSLTSSNAGGSRLVGRVHVTGLSSGIFEIRLAAGSFAQRDVEGPPYLLDVPISNPVGSVLVTLIVGLPAPQVPALGGAGALALAAALAFAGRRSLAAR